MKNICKVILLGRCANGMKLEYTQGNRAVAKFSVATNRSWKDGSGEWQESVEFTNCVLWGDAAGRLEGKVHKGTPLYVEGRLETRKWQDKEGRDRYNTDVICSEVIPLTSDVKGAEPAAPKKEFTPPPTPAADPFDDSDLPFS